MKLNRTGSNWNELERSKINENWRIIEGSYNDVVGQITDEVVGHLIDSAKLIWKEPVEAEADLPKDAEVGETRMVRESDDGVSYVFRYNGEKWELIQEIDATLVNEVDARLTAQLADKVSKNDVFINVKYFGAIGDGVTDDTQAIQNAFNNSLGHAVIFPAGNYKITNTIHAQASKVKAIIGYGAYVVYEGEEDVPAILFSGSLTTGTANPIDQTLSLSKSQHSPTISGLKIRCENRYVGIGLKLQNLLAPIISNVSVYGFKTGIELYDRLRNIIVEGCHVWDNEDYGIHWNGVNLHQNNIIGCHISRSKKALFFDNGDIHNIQITGCDIEGHASESLIHMLATASGSQVSQVQITGCTLEDHNSNTDALIVAESANNRYIGIIEIVGNQFSGSIKDAVRISGVFGLNISSNTVFNVNGYILNVTGVSGDINISNNTTLTPPGFFPITSLSPSLFRWQGDILGSLVSVNIQGNVLSRVKRKMIDIDITSGGNINELNISGNTVQYHVNANLVDYIFYIKANYLNGIMVSNNILRGREGMTRGILIRTTSSKQTEVDKLVVANNIIRGIDDNPNKYYLPLMIEGNTIYENNI